MFAVFPDINRVAGVDLFYPIYRKFRSKWTHAKPEHLSLLCDCIVAKQAHIRQANASLGSKSQAVAFDPISWRQRSRTPLPSETAETACLIAPAVVHSSRPARFCANRLCHGCCRLSCCPATAARNCTRKFGSTHSGSFPENMASSDQQQ